MFPNNIVVILNNQGCPEVNQGSLLFAVKDKADQVLFSLKVI